GIGGSAEFLTPSSAVDNARYDALVDTLTNQAESVLGSKIHWCVRVVPGNPLSVIADEAQESRASLIIMGIGRHRPMDRIFGAETTLRTIRRVRSPVLAIAANSGTLPR